MGYAVVHMQKFKAGGTRGIQSLKKLSQDYNQLKGLVPTMQERIQQSKDKSRLGELERVFSKLPEDVQKQLLPKIHTQDRER